MTDGHPEEQQRPSPTLEQLLADSHHKAGARLEEFTRWASAIQRRRKEDHVSDTDRITRSTALWTLMQLDGGIKEALESGGVSHKELGSVLSISDVQRPSTVRYPELHEFFAHDVREYLATLPAQRSVVQPADLALAIVNRAASTDSRGLLPGRLRNFKVKYDVILPALERLLPGVEVEGPGHTGNRPALSETMRAIAQELSGTVRTSNGTREITAFDIARAIGQRYPEYAGGSLAGAALEVPQAAVRRTWGAWNDDVTALYDRDVVADSRHQVLDGRLFLLGLGHRDTSLRTALEREGVWGPLVVEVDETVAPTQSELWSVFQAVQFAYGYQSDRPNGEDQLGVQGEVNAVCEVITDPEVKPPLAVGLFGEWGSGKSFFMEKMRERVAKRNRLHIVQIRFNAWHYADTSLWASLAIEIFERLADPEPVRPADRDQWLRTLGDPNREARQKLLSQLETYREAKAALDVERARLQAERDVVGAQLEKANQKRRKAVEKMPLTDIAGELAKDEGVRAAIDGVARQLGLAPAAEELIGLGSELRTMAGYLPAVWRLVQNKTWVVALMAASVVLALATAALIVGGGWVGLGSLVTAIGSVGTAVVTAVTFLRPAVRKANRALAAVERAIEAAAEKAAALRTQRSREERELELTLAETDREIAEATQAVAALDEKIASTVSTAEALTVGRRLYDFLADRAAGYQKHQGVVGMLYRDFRFLDAQLLAYRSSSEVTSSLPRVDRVILYIDDLDRCPPAKVLEVLEAVHLLLALELFVVVVGVDPRWLQRSLRHQYRDLAAGADAQTDHYLRDMPIEYLEKIFQIPLTLPAMEPAAYARLISSLAPSTGEDRPIETTPPTVTNRTVTSGSSGGDRVPTRAPLDVQPGSSASGDVGQPVDLTRAEIEFAQQLGALVASPRAAKRLMNTYRLLRATQHVGTRSRFLGGDDQPGEHQAVLTLLAVAAGYPTMVDRVLVALQADATRLGIGRWPDFVRELRPAGDQRPAGRLVPPDLASTSPDSGDGHERAAWTNLQSALESVLTPKGLMDLEPYKRWGRIVARFSFTL
ncbi:P-loop NTPase fold protein [Streptomyces sp. NPDC005374]|uniref:P-loop NTPase fold protein n=1 Tax=Streptomyces sp. NPDC005374 TaxID=3364713 RepID=UPI0036C58DC2